MSVRVMAAVWEHSQQTLGTRLVILALADYAHDDGSNAYPSVATLAKKAHMSERNAQYALRRLEHAGEIERQGTHDSGAIIWRITLPGMGANIAPAKSAPGAKTDTGGVQKPTETSAKSAPKSLRIKPSIEPSITPPISPSKKKIAMSADWQPAAESVAYAVSWGIPREDVAEVVEEFRAWWLENRPSVKRPGWDLTFKGRVRDVADRYSRRAARPSNGHQRTTTTDLILEAGKRVEERQRERERDNQDAGDVGRGLRAEDESGRAELGIVHRGMGSDAGGHPVDAAWRERRQVVAEK